MNSLDTPILPACSLLLAFSLLLPACDQPPEGPIERGEQSALDVDEDGPTTGVVEPVELEDGDAADLEPLAERPDTPEDRPSSGPSGFAADIDPQKILATGYWSWGTPGNNGGRVYIGPAAEQTCFLQGVTGELRSADGEPIMATARVAVDSEVAQWYIETDAGVADSGGVGGGGVMVHATCIKAVENRLKILWEGNTASDPGTELAFIPRTKDSHCFLSEISGSVGWASDESWVGLRRGSRGGLPTWELEGNLVTEADGSPGGRATAVCVDVPEQEITDYSWQAPPTPAWEPVTETTFGVTCSVHRLQGNLASNPYGWWDGPRVYPTTWFGEESWYVTGAGRKVIEGECLWDMGALP